MEKQVEFEPGDLVQLKSGGPVMVIESVAKDGSLQYCIAIWDVDGNVEEAQFNSVTLVHAKQDTTF